MLNLVINIGEMENLTKLKTKAWQQELNYVGKVLKVINQLVRYAEEKSSAQVQVLERVSEQICCTVVVQE